MFDLTTVSQDILIARGEYSTVRAAHEDAKKQLAIWCSELQAAAGQILRSMQPVNDGVPGDMTSLLDAGRNALTNIERLIDDVESLAEQRAALKKLAWPK